MKQSAKDQTNKFRKSNETLNQSATHFNRLSTLKALNMKA